MIAGTSISAVVAVSRNGIIGRDGAMPWRLSSDLQRFKRLTLGKPVVMGRKTFESIGRPLPGRPNFVVSRSGFRHPQVTGCDSLDNAFAAAARWCQAHDGHEICLIGGGQLYAQARDKLDIWHVTHVLADLDGDTRLDLPDLAGWQESNREDVPAGEKDSHPTRFVTYCRVCGDGRD